MSLRKILKTSLRICFYLIALIAAALVSFWAIQKISIRQQAVNYTPYADQKLTTAFQHAQVPYPPEQLAFLVFKNAKQLEIYARINGKPWQYIKTMPIFAASGHMGPKLREGDRQVPEGIYKITELNPFSDYLLSMKLNYPNDFDKLHAKLDHRKDPGSDIYIHGSDKSIGCMAMGDKGIEELFPLVYKVGTDNVTVIIAPYDFRKFRVVHYRDSPAWTVDLYHNIKNALVAFPNIK